MDAGKHQLDLMQSAIAAHGGHDLLVKPVVYSQIKQILQKATQADANPMRLKVPILKNIPSVHDRRQCAGPLHWHFVQ